MHVLSTDPCPSAAREVHKSNWKGRHLIEGVQARQSQWHFIQFPTVSATYASDCMCRREISVIGSLLFPVFSTEVISKVFRHTCVLYPPQTTDQHSPWWVSQVTSPSASPPSPTPTKRAATSTRGAPVLLSGAHCVPSVGSQQLLQWVTRDIYKH